VFGLSLLEALDDAGKLLVVKGQIGPAALAHDPGPHHGPLRQRRSTRYSASSATATRRKYSTTRSSTVLIVAARKSMTCVLTFDAGRPGPIGGAAPVSSEKAKAVRRSMLRSLSVYATRGGSPAILRTAASSESANITASSSWK